MHTGKVKKLIRDKGFGFIKDVDGRQVFFHKSTIIDNRFDSLIEDQLVEFEVEKSDKGPRAFNVKVLD
ncbi:MAG: cold shock domain-containing protein [Candidatus Gygaella obscura]|nr:cold shock domain-containing protein [Candidatus Gygaella obscura]